MERSRVLELRHVENNQKNQPFHIFGIFLNNVPSETYFLPKFIINACEYTNNESFVNLVEALGAFEFTQIEEIWKSIACVIHLVSISIDFDTTPSTIPDIYNQLGQKSRDHLNSFCNLSGVSSESLIMSLFFKWIRVKGESGLIYSALSPALVKGRIDSLAIEIYSVLFDNIVSHMNNRLPSLDNPTQSFIGILDIFGFESFKKNSLEQLCINYANERLYIEYINQVFVQVENLYKVEKINWTPIDVKFNKILDLIDGKFGIFNAIQEICRVSTSPLTTEKDIGLLSTRIHDVLKGNMSRATYGPIFSIAHFSNVVAYDCSEFIPKNRIALPDELDELLVLRFSKIKQSRPSTLLYSFKVGAFTITK